MGGPHVRAWGDPFELVRTWGCSSSCAHLSTNPGDCAVEGRGAGRDMGLGLWQPGHRPVLSTNPGDCVICTTPAVLTA